MWDVITGLVDTGVTVFLTTQYLEEADRLADRVAVLDGGRIVAEGSPEELKRNVAGQRLDLVLADDAAYAAARGLLGGRAVAEDRERLALSAATDGSAGHIRALLDEIDPHRTAVTRFSVHTATLDDVFLALTGHAAAPSTASGKETAGV
jgi:ABC-2 type transport system ATP-binding protein